MAFLAALFISVSASLADLQVGAAAVKITPVVGTPMAGYYHERGAEGVHDELYARALVLDDGVTKAAYVGLDLISTTRVFVEEARSLIEQRSGIPAAHVMVSATHSHTGPTLARASKRYDAFGAGNPLAIRYMDELPEKIAEAVAQAASNMQAVTCSFAVGHCEGIAFNRRFHMTDGSVGWNPGKRNPRIIRPAGPVDPDLPLVVFRRADGAPATAFVNYAIHLDTVSGAQFSADVPYTVIKLLQDAKGAGMIPIYATGCCGDVNHINVSTDIPQGGHGEAARIGTILAASALRAMNDVQPVTDSTIRVRSQIVPLPLPEVSKEDVQSAEEAIVRNNDPAVTAKPSFMELVKAYQTLDVDERKGKPWDVEVQAIAIGREVAIVSLPGEIFVELGITIRRGSPFQCTAVAELANGSIGYIPNRVAYPQGNYEVVSARCAAGSGELLVDATLAMLRDLYREAASR